MNAAIERRPTLRKATVADDVVAGLTTAPAAPAAPTPARSATPPRPAATSESALAPVPVRRGPGRPRSRKRMEPFSSKLEIGLRDEVDAYVDRYGESYVDLLDRALRAVIASPPPQQ